MLNFLFHRTNKEKPETDKKDGGDKRLQLTFIHCCFWTSDIEKITAEDITTPGKAGMQPIYQVTLKNGDYFQISEASIVDPMNGNIYYRDEDESFRFLRDVSMIYHQKVASPHLSNAAKEFAKNHGFPVQPES